MVSTLDDERIAHVRKYLDDEVRHENLSAHDMEWVQRHSDLVERSLLGRLIVPDFPAFAQGIREIYEECRRVRGGSLADYIPQLSKANPEHWAVAICTVDGQRAAFGDSDVPFCVQSCSKVINYAIAQRQLGSDRVHEHVGKEPSGQAFNQMSLDERKRNADLERRQVLLARGQIEAAACVQVRPALPHNPYISAGAIMTSSLISPDKTEADRFDLIMDTWRELSGAHPESATLREPTFSNSTYLSERHNADRNYCLGYMLRELDAFPAEAVDLAKVLETYFMLLHRVHSHEPVRGGRYWRMAAYVLSQGAVYCQPRWSKIVYPSCTLRDV